MLHKGYKKKTMFCRRWRPQQLCNDAIVWFCWANKRPRHPWPRPTEAGWQLIRHRHLVRPSPNGHGLFRAMPTRKSRDSSHPFRITEIVSAIGQQWRHQTHSWCKNLAAEPWNKEANMLHKQWRQQQQRKRTYLTNAALFSHCSRIFQCSQKIQKTKKSSVVQSNSHVAWVKVDTPIQICPLWAVLTKRLFIVKAIISLTIFTFIFYPRHQWVGLSHSGA